MLFENLGDAGRTLRDAVRTGDPDAVRWLLDMHGRSVTLEDLASGLERAIAFAYVNIVELLLERGPHELFRKAMDLRFNLQANAERGTHRLGHYMQGLLAKHIKARRIDTAGLEWLFTRQFWVANPVFIRALMQHGAVPTKLLYAQALGWEDASLLDAIEATGLSPRAPDFDHRDFCKLLVEDCQLETFLARGGQITECVWDFPFDLQTLIPLFAPRAKELGLDVNESCCWARPLAETTSRGNVTNVRLLLEAGADPNISGHDGATPLHQLPGDMRVARPIFELLLGAGANPTARNHEGLTPIEFFLQKDRWYVAELFLECPALLRVPLRPLPKNWKRRMRAKSEEHPARVYEVFCDRCRLPTEMMLPIFATAFRVRERRVVRRLRWWALRDSWRREAAEAGGSTAAAPASE